MNIYTVPGSERGDRHPGTRTEPGDRRRDHLHTRRSTAWRTRFTPSMAKHGYKTGKLEPLALSPQQDERRGCALAERAVVVRRHARSRGTELRRDVGDEPFWRWADVLARAGLDGSAERPASTQLVLAMSFYNVTWAERTRDSGCPSASNNYRAVARRHAVPAPASSTPSIFVFAAVAGQMVLGLHRCPPVQPDHTRACCLSRAIFILPILIPGIVIGAIWKLMLQLRFRSRQPGDQSRWIGAARLARRPGDRAAVGDRCRHLALDAVLLPACSWRDSNPCRRTSTRRLGSTAQLAGRSSFGSQLPMMMPTIMVTLRVSPRRSPSRFSTRSTCSRAAAQERRLRWSASLFISAFLPRIASATARPWRSLVIFHRLAASHFRAYGARADGGCSVSATRPIGSNAAGAHLALILAGSAVLVAGRMGHRRRVPNSDLAPRRRVLLRPYTCEFPGSAVLENFGLSAQLQKFACCRPLEHPSVPHRRACSPPGLCIACDGPSGCRTLFLAWAHGLSHDPTDRPGGRMVHHVPRTVGLDNTFTGLILAHTALNLPMALLLIGVFVREVPRELEEAARIDGASTPVLLLEGSPPDRSARACRHRVSLPSSSAGTSSLSRST